ncbi:hypothetical protein XELAEV_18004793mg [Xenopus laevis]|uniref:Uncharacterized protein n=1 Tax=Xenopus laevis TaxID=8355 RepID=A0A974DW12_XENLA|nr:hypothetical protein XELAEV_18004793mg [Xenopus laevis]
MGVPDTYLDFIAVHLVRLLNCMTRRGKKDWCELGWCHYPLEHSLWDDKWAANKSMRQHLLINTTLKIWHKNKITLHLTKAPYVLQLLTYNPNFPPGMERGAFAIWEKWDDKPTKIQDLVKRSKEREWDRPLTEWERIIDQDQEVIKPLSKMYNMVLNTEEFKREFRENWVEIYKNMNG